MTSFHAVETGQNGTHDELGRSRKNMDSSSHSDPPKISETALFVSSTNSSVMRSKAQTQCVSASLGVWVSGGQLRLIEGLREPASDSLCEDSKMSGVVDSEGIKTGQRTKEFLDNVRSWDPVREAWQLSYRGCGFPKTHIGMVPNLICKTVGKDNLGPYVGEDLESARELFLVIQPQT